jgi:hypothetical protein
LKFKPAKYNPEDVDGVDVEIEEVKANWHLSK